MLEESEVDFALEAVGGLEEIVKALITRYKNRGASVFCNLLNADLCQIRIWLENNRAQADPSYFNEILTVLEAICKGSSTWKPSPATGKTADLTEKYPELTKLVSKATYKDARLSLDKLSNDTGASPKEKASRQKRQMRIHQRFEHVLTKITNTEAAGVVEPRVTVKEDNDFSAHLGTLYTVLSRYSVCHDSSANIVPRISLSGYRRHDASGSVFDMLFPDHPHQDRDGSPCNWQNAVVHVGPEVHVLASKTFQDKIAAQPVPGIEYHEFCGTISGRHQEQLFLTVSKKDFKLHHSECPDSIGANVWMMTAPDSPALSLRKILARGELIGSNRAHNKVKIILFYLLTKGVWQFYESELMPTEWTKDTVEFLFEHRERNGTLTAGVFLNQPLISADFHPTPQKQHGHINLAHSFPKIRELGIMLLEILLGREIDSFRTEPEAATWLPGGKVTPYTDHRIAVWLFKSKIQTDSDMIKPLRDVIGRCLDDQSFKRVIKSKASPGQSLSSRLREAMYEQLVIPLESLLQVMYDQPYDLSPLHELNGVPATDSAGGIRRAQQQTIPVRNSRAPTAEVMGATVEGWPDDENACKRWFKEMDILQGLLLAKGNPQNVRIAIVDTGFSQEWGNLDWGIAPGNYKDFIDGQDHERRDNTGHGTDVAKLVLEVQERAELYVARVFEDERLTDNTFQKVEKALKWAVEKAVDIIVIASGTMKPLDNVAKAINTLPDHILVIAAAGNLPDCDRVVFPARMGRVMHIFATTARNKASRALNPPPLRRGYNFAILGEAIRPESGGWEFDERPSGTSFAAAIAAGFAGCLLHFSRLPVAEGERALNLEGYEKMNLIFEELSRDYRDQGYDCIVPWHLLNLITGEVENEGRRRRIRNYLSDVLQRM
ncbi:Alkaline protease [Madurella mycetomatis]|uniref:Alkaline protease n=1 Tax=Madurella mycetomatis TaxID=100816 RepID=A0A175WG47_9PEZI|nr:Alkaline protease [Madurella mycetomatis]